MTRSPEITGNEERAAEEPGLLRHSIGRPKCLPQGMAAETIIVLPIPEVNHPCVGGGSALRAMMHQMPFSERSCFPALHPSLQHGHQIDPPGLDGLIASDSLETFPPEQLTSPWHVLDIGIAIIIAKLFLAVIGARQTDLGGGSCHAEQECKAL